MLPHDRAGGWANIVKACYACSHALLSHSPPRFMCHMCVGLHRNSVGLSGGSRVFCVLAHVRAVLRCDVAYLSGHCVTLERVDRSLYMG